MNTKVLFPFGGGSNLILGTGTENQIFILRISSQYKLFPPNSQKLTLLCKKRKSLPIKMDLHDPYMIPHAIS